MLSSDVLVGGEESGGVGFGSHLPERDALYAALLLMKPSGREASPSTSGLADCRSAAVVPR